MHYTLQPIMEADWQPVERATLLFIIKDGMVLLIRKKRGLGAGKINGPGGRLDPGETPLQAAVREVQEEVCVTPLGIQEAGLLRFQFVDGHSIEGTVYTAIDCEGVPQETDEADPFWVSVDAIPYTEMWADDALWMPLVLKGVFFKGYFIFDGDTMLEQHVDTGMS